MVTSWRESLPQQSNKSPEVYYTGVEYPRSLAAFPDCQIPWERQLGCLGLLSLLVEPPLGVSHNWVSSHTAGLSSSLANASWTQLSDWPHTDKRVRRVEIKQALPPRVQCFMLYGHGPCLSLFRPYFPGKVSTLKRTSVWEFHDENPEIPGSLFSLSSRINILLSVWDDSGACVLAASHHLLYLFKVVLSLFYLYARPICLCLKTHYGPEEILLKGELIKRPYACADNQ